MKKCKQCGKPLNPVSALLNPVCSNCCRKNQKQVTKGGNK